MVLGGIGWYWPFGGNWNWAVVGGIGWYWPFRWVGRKGGKRRAGGGQTEFQGLGFWGKGRDEVLRFRVWGKAGAERAADPAAES